MKEHPILFGGPMVRAILDGRKTVTRRLIKFRRHLLEQRDDGSLWPWLPEYVDGGELHACDQARWMSCPYGDPGDRLWVRETFAFAGNDDGHPVDECGNPCDLRCAERLYRADCGAGAYGLEVLPDGREYHGKWRPSIHMPRWASRLTLEVVSVRVEQLQEIWVDDCLLEGIEPIDKPLAPLASTFGTIGRFSRLWDEINGKRAPWESNPWVWRIEFRRAEA